MDREREQSIGAEPSLPVTFVWLTLFAIAFAWIESAVVHYLHLHFYPDGFRFPLVQWPLSLLIVEVGRELSTMVVLASVAFFAARGWWRKFAFFMFSFGVWDIFYYYWLLLFEGWPESLLTPDLLFLVPVPWEGPVLAPLIASVLLILSAIAIVWTEERRGGFSIRTGALILVLISWALILFSFVSNALTIMKSGETGPFNWWVFLGGMVIWAVVLIVEVLENLSIRADEIS